MINMRVTSKDQTGLFGFVFMFSVLPLSVSIMSFIIFNYDWVGIYLVILLVNFICIRLLMRGLYARNYQVEFREGDFIYQSFLRKRQIDFHKIKGMTLLEECCGYAGLHFIIKLKINGGFPIYLSTLYLKNDEKILLVNQFKEMAQQEIKVVQGILVDLY